MDDFARVKDAVDLVDVVSRYVPLKRAGTRMVGLCPFHPEKSPSFGIKVGEKFFKCFGCGKGGDVFTFVAEVERIERIDALRRLAEEAGIELSGGRSPSRDEKERLRKLLTTAQELYRRAFASSIGAPARELAASRRLSAETIEAFGIGYAPIDPESRYSSAILANRLVAAGHRREDVIAAGIAAERDGALVDSLRDRLTFPVRDERGQVIAFGGRRMRDRDASGADVKDPKYINSRETLVFSKSRVLYGLDRARTPILKHPDERARQVVLVEGYLDVILAHQGGLDTAVAALGTAVTQEHARHLSRLAPRAVLFLDGDQAGQRAAERAVPILLAEKLEVRVLVLQSDKDPGDFFARGSTRADFDALLAKDGVSGLDYLLSRAGRRDARTIEDRVRVARRVGESLAQIADPLARASAVAHLARELDLPTTDLDATLGLRSGRRAFAAVASANAGNGDGKDAPTAPERPPLPRAQVIAEEDLLSALVRDPNLRAHLRGGGAGLLPGDAVVDPVRKRLFQGLVEEPTTDPGKTVESLLGRFAGEPDAQQVLLDLVDRPASADPGKLFDGAVRFFERERRKREATEIRAGFEKRLAAGDPEASAEFLRQYVRLRKGSGGGASQE
jgi:DNA primase